MKRRTMETQTNPTDPSSSPPAADPRWVILNCYGYGVPSRNDGDRVIIADAETVAAESCTSTGRHFRVSMGLAPPPACSYLYHAMVGASAPFSAVEDDDDDDTGYSQVVAAHGDSVLFLMVTVDGADYFVYTAGAGAGASRSRNPRLNLLPKSHIPHLYKNGYQLDDDDDGIRALNLSDTGLLRRGEDEILVAQLEVPFGEPRDTAELCVLHVGGGGSGGWELNKAVPIVQEHGGGKVHMLRDWWKTAAVIPVGDRYLCWLNYLTGFLLWDTAASPPKLRFIRLPSDLVGDEEEEAIEEYTRNNNYPSSMKRSRNMCAAGADAVRLVSVDSRCCCGGQIPGSSMCKRSRFAFTVTTWTLKLRMTTATVDETMMTWVQDGVVDSDELWALPEYGSLPRVPLEYPIPSSDDPDVVYFRVRNDYSCYLTDEDRKVWLLEVDTRRKRLRSVLPTTIPLWKQDSDNIQANFH